MVDDGIMKVKRLSASGYNAAPLLEAQARNEYIANPVMTVFSGFRETVQGSRFSPVDSSSR